MTTTNKILIFGLGIMISGNLFLVSQNKEIKEEIQVVQEQNILLIEEANKNEVIISNLSERLEQTFGHVTNVEQKVELLKDDINALGKKIDK